MMTEAKPSRRIPWVAAVLSLLCTGLGHLYCGRIVIGLVLFVAAYISAPLIIAFAFIAGAFIPPSTPLMFVGYIVVVAMIGVYLFAVIDAYRIARRLHGGYQIKDYNRVVIYVLLVVASNVIHPVWFGFYGRATSFTAFIIAGTAGFPNLVTGERIQVNRLKYRWMNPRRGDVVAYRAPPDRSGNRVSRVIGLPGDSVAMENDDVIVNGNKLQRESEELTDRLSMSEFIETKKFDLFYETMGTRRYLIALKKNHAPSSYPATTVPPGCLFVLFDNRHTIKDSRQFGFVPIGDVYGPVQYIYTTPASWSRLGAFEN